MNKGNTSLRGVAVAVCSVDCFAALAMTDGVLTMTDGVLAMTDGVLAMTDEVLAMTDRGLAMTGVSFAMTGASLAVSHLVSARSGATWQSTGSSFGCGRLP